MPHLTNNLLLISVSLTGLIILFYSIEKYYSNDPANGPAFPKPSNGWKCSGNNIRLKLVPALRAASSTKSRRRTISPYFDELRARTVWERSSKNNSEIFFYAKGSVVSRTVFASLPIYILYGVDICDGHVVLSNRALFAKMGYANYDDVNAKMLAKQIDGNLFAEGFGVDTVIRQLNGADPMLLKKFLLIERFEDSLVLAGRHGWRGDSTERFLVDVLKIRNILNV